MTRLGFIGRASQITAVTLVVAGSLAFTSRVASRVHSERATTVTTPAGDSAEVSLALSAAPATLTAGAAVYVWHDVHFVQARTGTTGVACMVSRDPRVGGVFPMCFDPEAARTQMPEEMMKTELHTRRLDDAAVQGQVDAAFARGALQHPTKPAIMYMMSSHQLLTVTDAQGTHLVGAWRPHIMIYMPQTSVAQFALGAEDDAGPVSAPFVEGGGVELIVQVPHWADSRVPPDSTRT